MPDFVPALVCYPHGYHDLIERGGRGAIWPVGASKESVEFGAWPERWQVCCPGCGRVAYAFESGKYAIAGAVEDRRIVRDNSGSLSLDRPVTFVPCGCGTWDLFQSVWRFKAPLAKPHE